MPARAKSVPTQQLLDFHPRGLFQPKNSVRLKNGQCKWVRGLAVSLKGVFYPGFKKPASYGNSSTALGIRVHREMEHWVNGAPEETTKKRSSSSTSSTKAPRKKKLHPFTVQFQRALAKLGLQPTAAEVPLLSYRGHFLTRSDLICRRFDRDELVVVSLKTGYNRGYSMAGKRKPCLGIHRPNCFKTHHQIQLGLEVASIEEDYGIKVAGAYVIYAGWGTKKQTRIDPLEPWARTADNRSIMFQMMRHNGAREFRMPDPSELWTPENS